MRPIDEKRTSVSRAQISWTSVDDEAEVLRQVAWNVPKQRLVDEGGDLELDLEASAAGVELVRCTECPNGGVLDRLKAMHQIVDDAIVQRNRVARVQSTGSECVDHRLCGIIQRAADNWSQLLQVEA